MWIWSISICIYNRIILTQTNCLNHEVWLDWCDFECRILTSGIRPNQNKQSSLHTRWAWIRKNIARRFNRIGTNGNGWAWINSAETNNRNSNDWAFNWKVSGSAEKNPHSMWRNSDANFRQTKIKTSIFANGRQAISETASDIYQNRNAKKVYVYLFYYNISWKV